MSYPVTHAYNLNLRVAIDLPDEGGLSVTFPDAPPFQLPNESEPNVTPPPGTVIPPVCISLGGDGNFIVSIPAGLTVTFPLGQIEGMLLNGVELNPRVAIKFPSGGTITVPRRISNTNEISKKRVKIDGLGASMDPLP